jgi:3-oxoacyl-[acyl-carrier protein] reductase
VSEKVFIHAPEDSGVPERARDFGVRDRVVIVTGAGQGIGREYARQFAAAGAIAVAADIDGPRAESVQREIEATGGRAMAVRVDIGDERSVAEMTETVVSRYGRIDVLVNNAAIFATLKKQAFDEIPLDEWEQVMRINVTGTFLCTRAVAPTMRRAGWGRVINISSVAVTLGAVNYLHYVTSKAAVIGMTNSLARELGPHGITVNCIRPGAVATEVERAVNPTQERRAALLTLQCVPKGQLPEDLVGLAVFLASPAAGFISGQTISCDGGLTHSH